MGEPGSEAFCCDQQVVKNDEEIAKTKALQVDFLNPLENLKSLLGIGI